MTPCIDTPANPTPGPSNRMEGLDLLRFAAASAVLAYHYFFIGPLQGFWPKSMFTTWTHLGDFGVDLFFVISGFVISLTAEGRSSRGFLISRAVRLIPAFFACSTLLAAIALASPSADRLNILTRWLASQTFFPRLFGQEPLSAVYWTLTIEVQFYLGVAALIALGWWKKHAGNIMGGWLCLALVNQAYFQNPLAETLLLTEFAGHFGAGFFLYRWHRNGFSLPILLGLVVSWPLITIHIQHVDGWLSGAFGQPLSPLTMVLLGPAIVLLVGIVSRLRRTPLPARWSALLGGMSYPLYLVHADLGFWSHAVFERLLFPRWPRLTDLITYPHMVTLATVTSLGVAAYVTARLEPRLQPRLRQRLQSTPLLRQPVPHSVT